MFRSNYFYGHEQILRAYCGGRARLPFLPGTLQHGWNPRDGLGPRHREGPWPKYVWSSRNVRGCEAFGVQRVRPIGAPFLYLPVPNVEPRGGLIVFPHHGWEKQRVLMDAQAYARDLEALRSEGFERITVCLYHLELHSLGPAFEARGFRTVTAGPRDGNPGFLDKIQALLLEHEYASSNRVCTAAFYALSLGRKFFLFGPRSGSSGSDDPTGEKFDAWQRAEFPQLAFESFGDRAHVDIGRQELGAEHKLDPAGLRDALLWSPPRRAELARVLGARALDLGRKAGAELRRRARR